MAHRQQTKPWPKNRQSEEGIIKRKKVEVIVRLCFALIPSVSAPEAVNSSKQQQQLFVLKRTSFSIEAGAQQSLIQARPVILLHAKLEDFEIIWFILIFHIYYKEAQGFSEENYLSLLFCMRDN